MGIIWVEFCLISAHGLQQSTSLWKRHWYAVGWIDDNSKYCTKIDDSGNANPVWRTNFAVPVDDSMPNIQDLTLNVEVYSIDPIFFKEKLHGSTTVGLKKFLDKQMKNSEMSIPKQDGVRSYQLRKRKSSKPKGFIDILIHISDDEKEPGSHTGIHLFHNRTKLILPFCSIASPLLHLVSHLFPFVTNVHFCP